MRPLCSHRLGGRMYLDMESGPSCRRMFVETGFLQPFPGLVKGHSGLEIRLFEPPLNLGVQDLYLFVRHGKILPRQGP